VSELTCIVVDDEPLARDLLRGMLESYPEVELVAECSDGRAALKAIRKLGPDLVFLDVEMPKMDGFDLIQELDPETMPAIVFVTAYDRYALRAFEIHALDYLLKPFDEERLDRALKRARGQLDRSDRGEELARVLALLEDLGARDRFPDRIAIRRSDRTILQPVAEIDWLEADGKHVKIHVAGKTYAIREAMSRIERQLDPRRFLRVSRSAIVNVDRIREVQPWFHGDHVVVLENGDQVTTTRTYRSAVNDLLQSP
jgi:two-component system, LytTR family, response regulator